MSKTSVDIVFVMPSMAPEMRQESIGTLILAQKAVNNHYKVAIVRFWEASRKNYNLFADDICERINQHNPRIVSFYCRASEYHIILDIAQRIKNYSSQTTIVLGGPQAELASEDTLNSFPCVDYICCGEGENTIVPLLNMILHKEADITKQAIPGLVYRNSFLHVTKNNLPELLPDNYKRNYLYYGLIPENVIRNSKSVTIDVGRGCPFSCTFCSTKTFWKQKYRLRDIDDTISEIEYVNKHNRNILFSFSHDLFTVNKKKVLDFCDKISALKKDIKWTCSARLDCIDEYLIEKMSSAGLVGIYYGIETGSERMQKIINKNLNIERCIEIVRTTIKHNISVTASFIYGFPDENYDDLNKTLELINILMQIGANVQLHCLTIEKGSKIYEEYKSDLTYSIVEQQAIFGANELSDKIQQYSSIFSTFWNYNTQLRTEMKYLHTVHAIGREYPVTYILLISILIGKGLKHVEAYKQIIGSIQDSLIRFEKNNVGINKSISYFLFEKLLSRLSMERGNDVHINDNELTKLRSSLVPNKK